ncbi:hypothetical protein LTR29_009316 [Friedmanniomyces endolithicus]|nr:hypothetical protein LTR29_009316 [Friedmanniomyces endolithicus]
MPSDSPRGEVTRMGTARLWASWAAATFGLLVGLLTVRYRQFYPDVKKALAEEAEEAKQPNFPEAKKHFTGFKLLAHGAMLLVVCAGLVINVLAFVSIRKLRNFIGTYADIKGPNEESNAMSFGQSIVITLTGLIALTFIDKTCEQAREYLKDTKEKKKVEEEKHKNSHGSPKDKLLGDSQDEEA